MRLHPHTLFGLGLSAVAMAATVGCTDVQPTYYDDEAAGPTFESFDIPFEAGNIGGQERRILGSGFGDDPDSVVVLFDNHNAHVKSVTDSEIVVETPRGPVTLGAVDVIVGTPTGYVEVEGGYTFQRAEFLPDEDGDPETANESFYEGQEYFVAVRNWYNSCIAGIGSPIGGCDGSASFGTVGISAQAEFPFYPYPKYHNSQSAFWQANDESFPVDTDGDGNFDTDGWSFQLFDPVTPDPVFRERVSGRIFMRNLDLVAEDGRDTDVCVDLAASPSAGIVPCDETAPATAKRYDSSVLELCETRDPTDGRTSVWAEDYPINQDFFVSFGGDPEGGTLIELNIEGMGQTRAEDLEVTDGEGYDLVQELLLPPPITSTLQLEGGFGEGIESLALTGLLATCPDGDGDGSAALTEEGLVFSWRPYDVYTAADPRGDSPLDVWKDTEAGQAVRVNSYVRFSVTLTDETWYGRENRGLRASVTVPDAYRFDPTTGRSSLGIPNEILYRFPTTDLSCRGENEFAQTGFLCGSDDNPSLLWIEIVRITDYRIETPVGPTIFSYSTGDFGAGDFWSHPLEREGGTCADCYDNARATDPTRVDRWVDELDPDCNPDDPEAPLEEDVRETTIYGDYTCNDGIDNNGDGLVDFDDPLCVSGFAGESSCTDGTDNDEDGWLDELDNDCDPDDPDAQEDGSNSDTACSDGLDSDGDGWIDVEDPGCEDGFDDDEGGLGTTECNDGEDNDGRGGIDFDDPICKQLGAEDNEDWERASQCIDSADNDGDGFYNEFDLNCAMFPFTRENFVLTPEVFPIVPACFDGLDNDGDGLFDADDPSCWNPNYGWVADGWHGDESTDWNAVDGFATECTDGIDNDGDGLVDGRDGDCAPAVPGVAGSGSQSEG